KHDNVAQIPTGFGGIVYMLVTMIFIGAVIIFEAWPVYRIFMAQTIGRQISLADWTAITSSFAIVIAVNILAVVLPMKIGLSRLSQQEI
ncbi:MAG: putative ABC transporter permease subunit, partial [Nitrospirota bacterium]